MRGVVVALAASCALLAGCYQRDTSNECARGMPCECTGAAPCTKSCPLGGCTFTCTGSGECSNTCAGGGCSQTCAGSGACTLTCEGGGCRTTCSGSGMCRCLMCAALDAGGD